MIKDVVAVAAGKGGVGKSTIAVHLALALASQGLQVGLIDADLYGPSIRHMLPEESLPAAAPSGKILPAFAKNIAYISIDFFRANQEASLMRAPLANAAIGQFLDQVEWGELDLLLIDFPPGTGDIQLTLAQQANLSGALLITLPQEISFIDVRKAAELFVKAKVPLLGVVENMHGLFPGNAGVKLSEETDAPLLTSLPFDRQIAEAADRGSVSSLPLFEKLAVELRQSLASFKKGTKEGRFTLQDDAVLHVEWDDGLTSSIPLADLQRQCPCARCRESERKVEQKVFADQLEVVGNYGLRIHYRTGCSKGVYPYELLRLWRSHA